MRLADTLIHVAFLLSVGATACRSNESACGGCCGETPTTNVTGTPAQACAIAQPLGDLSSYNDACGAVCGAGKYCKLPSNSLAALDSATDGGVDGGDASAADGG